MPKYTIASSTHKKAPQSTERSRKSHSLSTFTFTILLLIPGLITACCHQSLLPHLTLTAASNVPGKNSGSLNATGGGSDNFTNRIYLWYYCVSGVAAEAGEYMNATCSCHQAKQDTIFPLSLSMHWQ